MLTHHFNSWREIEHARHNLTKFVVDQAREIVRTVGFGYAAVGDAPNTLAEVLEAFDRSSSTGCRYPVSGLNCEFLIFHFEGANHAMRMWHDMCHATMGFTFDAEDEMLLGAHHLRVLREHGYEAGSLEHRLLHADTIGQNLCFVETGSFPVHQLSFAMDAANYSVHKAIDKEVQRRLRAWKLAVAL